jgi:DEAD/DEAH box helicase domain-containing protein
MISLRCRKHRQPMQQLWQVAKDGSYGRAGRPLGGNFNEGLTPGGWVKEDRNLVPGLYCQLCLADGDIARLGDYDQADLADAGLLDTPHVGQGADDFELDVAWKKLSQPLAKLVVATRDRKASPAKTDTRLRTDPRLHCDLRTALYGRMLAGGDLWSHQAAAIDAGLEHKDVVVETATASGKSLCYWIPVLNEILKTPATTALYIAPLNALVEDQLRAVERFGSDPPLIHTDPGSFAHYTRSIRIGSRSVLVARYDGTLDHEIRRAIRNARPKVVVTNPEMLHRSIIPHHGKAWTNFMSNLRYLVLDEMHVYKGMFGASFANILRRLFRLAAHYGNQPQIIGCSASIGNAKALFHSLTGRDEPILISAAQSGAPVYRQRRVILDVAKAKEALPTVAKEIVIASVADLRARTLAFMRSIPEVDQVYRSVTGELGRSVRGLSKATVREYKREIPPDEKAKVTANLRSGATLGVISTTALQLGIDIGDLAVCLICKFPGSKASFFQQAGRVGRRGESLVLFLADESPLDQHFVRRPEELLDAPSEVVYLNPDHRQTVLDHLWCAAEELPFDLKRDSKFWGKNLAQKLAELIAIEKKEGRDVLVRSGTAGDRAKDVDVRSLGFECVIRDEGGKEVCRPEALRAMRRFHKFGRFQVQDQAFEVLRLSIDWLKKKAEGTAWRLDTLDYTTSSVRRTECAICGTEASQAGKTAVKLEHGPVRFIEQVEGYFKIPAARSELPTYESLGKASPAPRELETHGLWFSAPSGWIDEITVDDRLPSVRTVSESLRIAAGLMCSTDPDDIGVHVEYCPPGLAFRVFLADNADGGNGLTQEVFHQAALLIDGALRILKECPHCKKNPASRGCHSCVTTAWGGDEFVCRIGGIAILKKLKDAFA